MSIQCYILQSGVYIKYNQFPETAPLAPLDIKKYFTIKTKTIGETYVQTTQCRINKKTGYIILPRFGFYEMLANPKFLKKIKISPNDFKITNKITLGTPPKTPFKWQGTPQGNQLIVFNHIKQNYYTKENVINGKSGVIIHLEAGQGKTFLAMNIINFLQRKTLVVVHSTAVMLDWVKETTKLFPTSQIGQYYGKKKVDGDIIIAVIDSLLTDKFEIRKNHERGSNSLEFNIKQFFSQFGLVIFDEVHEYCSKCRSEIFWRAQTAFMLGLSATPNERLNKFDPVAWWGVGPVLNCKTIPGYSETDIPFKGRVKMVKYLGPDEYTMPILCEKTQIISVPLMLNNITKDQCRIIVICNEIKELYAKGLFIFVFADRCDYLAQIKKRLLDINIQCEIPNQDLDPSPKNGISEEQFNTCSASSTEISDDLNRQNIDTKVVKITGGASADEMKKAESSARVILTTYQYLSTGKSIPKMNAIVLTTPRKTKSKQILGRIFRLGSNYDIERQIIDIVDWNTIFKHQWYKRKKIYDEKQYPIDVKKISYLDFNNIDTEDPTQ